MLDVISCKGCGAQSETRTCEQCGRIRDGAKAEPKPGSSDFLDEKYSGDTIEEASAALYEMAQASGAGQVHWVDDPTTREEAATRQKLDGPPVTWTRAECNSLYGVEPERQSKTVTAFVWCCAVVLVLVWAALIDQSIDGVRAVFPAEPEISQELLVRESAAPELEDYTEPLSVRYDTENLALGVSSNGDYAALQVDATGSLYVRLVEPDDEYAVPVRCVDGTIDSDSGTLNVRTTGSAEETIDDDTLTPLPLWIDATNWE